MQLNIRLHIGGNESPVQCIQTEAGENLPPGVRGLGWGVYQWEVSVQLGLQTMQQLIQEYIVTSDMNGVYNSAAFRITLHTCSLQVQSAYLQWYWTPHHIWLRSSVRYSF